MCRIWREVVGLLMRGDEACGGRKLPDLWELELELIGRRVAWRASWCDFFFNLCRSFCACRVGLDVEFLPAVNQRRRPLQHLESSFIAFLPRRLHLVCSNQEVVVAPL